MSWSVRQGTNESKNSVFQGSENQCRRIYKELKRSGVSFFLIDDWGDLIEPTINPSSATIDVFATEVVTDDAKEDPFLMAGW